MPKLYYLHYGTYSELPAYNHKLLAQPERRATHHAPVARHHVDLRRLA
jgi:hypothetical protein